MKPSTDTDIIRMIFRIVVLLRHAALDQHTPDADALRGPERSGRKIRLEMVRHRRMPVARGVDRYIVSNGLMTTIVARKGEIPHSHGYSAFEGHTPQGKRFLTGLRDRGINHLYVAGLATDYCVKHSALDALPAA
jgi:nicotinamidase-related amidase